MDELVGVKEDKEFISFQWQWSIDELVRVKEDKELISLQSQRSIDELVGEKDDIEFIPTGFRRLMKNLGLAADEKTLSQLAKRLILRGDERWDTDSVRMCDLFKLPCIMFVFQIDFDGHDVEIL